MAAPRRHDRRAVADRHDAVKRRSRRCLQLRFVKKLKNGFSPHARGELLERLGALASNVNPFVNLPEPPGRSAIDAKVMKSVYWLKPELIVEVEFVEWTSAKKLRHARFRRVP
jgi:bifunctional non-homologous end joining protein LigD